MSCFKFTPIVKKLILFLFDGISIPLALWLALSLRLGYLYTGFGYSTFLLFAALTILTLSAFITIGMYRMVLRYAGVKLVETLGLGVLASTGILLLLVIFGKEAGFPRSAFIIYGTLLFVFVGGFRIIALRVLGVKRQHLKAGRPVIIYGAGDSGQQLVGLLHSGPEYIPVAFLDDDIQLHGREIEGLKVHLPDDHKLLDKLHKKGVEEILLAIPSASIKQRKRIIKRLESLPFHVRTVPDFKKIMSGRAQLDQLEELRLEDQEKNVK